MALAPNLALTTIFGPSAVIEGTGPTATIKITLAELGVDGNIDSTSPEDLSTEGILLALLQRAHTSQGTNTARIFTSDKLSPTITTRGPTGEVITVRTERYTTTFYSPEGGAYLDPDLI